MSRKEKLAAEYADDNASNGFTKFVLLKGFLAGYAACEQDAKVLEEAIVDCIHSLENCDEKNWVKESIKLAKKKLAKWKERGE